jgi:hypothetical protein
MVSFNIFVLLHSVSSTGFAQVWVWMTWVYSAAAVYIAGCFLIGFTFTDFTDAVFVCWGPEQETRFFDVFGGLTFGVAAINVILSIAYMQWHLQNPQEPVINDEPV